MTDSKFKFFIEGEFVIDNNYKKAETKNISKEYKASQRKAIKVAPSIYDLIKTMSVVTNTKMYDLVQQMVKIYMDTNVSERQKETILLMIKETKHK